MVKTVATVLGVGLLIIGVLGFVPGVTNDNNLVLGLFKVDALHNLVHIVTGILALYAGLTSAAASRMYFQIFGVVYSLVAILGFVYSDGKLLGLMANNLADTWLHVVIAVLALYLGFGTQEETTEEF